MIFRGASVALGNFDGVHRGHAAVVAAAAEHPAPLAAAVFSPHPRRFFQPDLPPFRLQSDGQRARALKELGVTTVYEVTFDAELASMTDAEFVRRVLVDRFGVAAVAVGFDFRFGRARMGDCARLEALGAEFGFAVRIVDAVDDAAHAGDKISSSAVRDALREGDPEAAAAMLGRPWAVDALVQEGFKRGRELGFPTLNQSMGDYVRPKFGVYATRTDIGDGIWRDGVSHIGVNPTVGALPEPLLETHLFDFDADLYGARVETRLLRFLRPELVFPDLEELKAQMRKDAETARALLD